MPFIFFLHCFTSFSHIPLFPDSSDKISVSRNVPCFSTDFIQVFPSETVQLDWDLKPRARTQT